jgi:tetratricopeptide (TPR) repeat protein
VRKNDALAQYDAVLARQNDNPDALWGSGAINYNLRKYEAALDRYSTYNRLYPGNARVLAFEGDALQQVGQPEDARKKYRAALAIDPEDTFALEGMKRLGGDL